MSCKDHRTAKTVGTCKRCGKPVCGNCSIIYKGRYYCISGCIPQEILSKKSLSSQSDHQSKIPGKIMITTITVFIICSITTGIFGFLEINKLRSENHNLRENRSILINALKSSNQEIANLKDSFTNSKAIDTVPKIDTVPIIDNKISKRIINTFVPSYTPDYTVTRSFNNGSPDKKLLSFTFDGGADANTALPILDTLNSRNVKSTLFLTGQFIRKFPDIVRIYLNAGHEIGNHTFSHPHLTTYAKDRTQTILPDVNKEFLCGELKKNNDLFYSLTGQHFAPFWRAPYGEYNKTLCTWASECGYTHVGWRQGPTWRLGLDSNDWIPEDTPGFKTPSEVLDKILGMARSNSEALNGGIVLMHLGSTRKNSQMHVYTVLGTLIDSLHQRGYSIVPVSEMIQQSGFYLASSPSNIHFQDSTF